jgi:hypothetical protein
LARTSRYAAFHGDLVLPAEIETFIGGWNERSESLVWTEPGITRY